MDLGIYSSAGETGRRGDAYARAASLNPRPQGGMVPLDPPPSKVPSPGDRALRKRCSEPEHPLPPRLAVLRPGATDLASTTLCRMETQNGESSVIANHLL